MERCDVTGWGRVDISDVDALIFDFRHNGGGQPEVVALVASYLFGKRTHLNDIYDRAKNKTTALDETRRTGHEVRQATGIRADVREHVFVCRGVLLRPPEHQARDDRRRGHRRRCAPDDDAAPRRPLCERGAVRPVDQPDHSRQTGKARGSNPRSSKPHRAR